MMAAVSMETGRLVLRDPVIADAPAIQHIASDARVALMTATIPHPYPPGGAEEFIRKMAEANRRLNKVILFRPDRRVVGLVGSALTDDTADIAYMIDPAFWGRGIATEAASRVVDYRFDSDASLSAMWAGTMVGNTGSRRVLEKVGFTAVGEKDRELPVRGGTYRIAQWRLTRDEHNARRRELGAR
jgi:RimJ/RimL family protein N-acetyltransferase